MDPGQRAASTRGSPPVLLLACARGAISCLSRHRCTDKPPADRSRGGQAEGGHRVRRLPAGTWPRRGHGHAGASPMASRARQPQPRACRSPGEQSELPRWFWCCLLGFLPAGTELVSPDPAGEAALLRDGSGLHQPPAGACLSVHLHASVRPSVSWVRCRPRQLSLALRSSLSASTRQDGTEWASGLAAERCELSSPQHTPGAMGSEVLAPPAP